MNGTGPCGLQDNFHWIRLSLDVDVADVGMRQTLQCRSVFEWHGPRSANPPRLGQNRMSSLPGSHLQTVLPAYFWACRLAVLWTNWGFADFFPNRTHHSGILGGGVLGGKDQGGKWSLDARFNNQGSNLADWTGRQIQGQDSDLQSGWHSVHRECGTGLGRKPPHFLIRLTRCGSTPALSILSGLGV